MEYKNFKYNTLSNEVTTSKASQHNKELCQLLSNASPLKVNCLVSTMTFDEKPAAMAQPQQPDVMLMPTTISTPISKLTQRQLEMPAQEQQQNFNAHSLMSSSHHCHERPLQTFHIVATATTCSSMQQQQQQQQQQATTSRNYATLQTMPMTQLNNSLRQQHFVAVPANSLIQFQTLPTKAASTPQQQLINTTTIPPSHYLPTVTQAKASYGPLQPPPLLLALSSSAIRPTTTITTATTCMNSAPLLLPSNATTNIDPLVKYHSIQLHHKKSNNHQHKKKNGTNQINHHLTSLSNSSITSLLATNEDRTFVMATLPKPSSGVSAKFVTKPFTTDINSFIAKSTDAIAATPKATSLSSSTPSATVLTTTKATTVPYADVVGSKNRSVETKTLAIVMCANVEEDKRAGILGTGGATTAPIALSSTTTVDIMDDEEEQEQQRIGNYPHGTPSRIPLIASQNCNSGMISKPPPSTASPSPTNCNGITASGVIVVVGDAKDAARGLFNATAASFHRHKLQHFQRGKDERKMMFSSPLAATTTATRRQSDCNVYNRNADSLSNHKSNNKCTTETSDDDEIDEEYIHHKQQHDACEEYVLEHIKSKNNNQQPTTTTDDDYDEDDGDDNDDDDDDDDNIDTACKHRFQQHFQVPISVVLLILICYICIGTCIFAVWENWSLIDGAYFCFVTLSTIGYGDFIPAHTFHGPEVQLFICCAYLLIGLVLVAMSFSILETQLMWKCKRIAVRLKLAKD